MILFFCEPISSDTIPRGFLAPRYRKEYFCSPTCGTSTILVHLPCTQNSKGESPGRRAAVTMTNEPSNHRPTSHFEVARTKEPS